MPQPLPRSYRHKQQAEDAAKLEKILKQTAVPESSSSAGATSGGDERRLRGLAGDRQRCQGRDLRLGAWRAALMHPGHERCHFVATPLGAFSPETTKPPR